MGGHGGLNILPQKRWNVYNFDNREKVLKDEQEAAKQEQLKREQSRKRDTEFRIQQLRQARGLAPGYASASSSTPVAAEPVPSPKAEAEAEPKSKHINLFEGIKILDPVEVLGKRKSELGDEKRKGFKKMKKEAEAPKVVLPEDEVYRLGYGVAGKGVKMPWYMEKRANGDGKGVVGNDDECESETVSKSSRKKSVEELREERLKREGREKEREWALMRQKGRTGTLVRNDRGYSRRC